MWSSSAGIFPRDCCRRLQQQWKRIVSTCRKVKSKLPPAGDSVNSAAEAMLQRLVQQVEPAGDSVNSAAEAMLQQLVEEFVSGKKFEQSPTLPLTQKAEST